MRTSVKMIKKIYPSTQECKIKNFVICNEKDCGKVFKCESNLNLHLAKTHGKTELLKNNNIKQYHCPETQCIYHTEKHLKNMKSLRQHYLKVHMKKDHSCNHCQKNFTTPKSFQNHLLYCGVKFSCECKASYPSYETLQTHARRKRHKIPKKQEYAIKIIALSKIIPVVRQERFISPKPVNLMISNSNINTSIQDHCYKIAYNKDTRMSKEQIIEISQETQTNLRPLLSSVGTQTDDNSNFKAGMSSIKNQRTIDTQTDNSESAKIPPKIAHSVIVNDMSNTIMNSSSTQTSANLNPFVSSDKIRRSISNNSPAIIGESTLNNNINNFEFDNCHMETQTDFILDDVMFSSDYLMSNMYTQTCDDYLNQFNFNDIQTQTVFDDDMLKSVESQTFTSARLQNMYACKDMSHTETQTDSEFRQMLEVINS